MINQQDLRARLPELPKPKRFFGHSTNLPMYTSEEMKDYALEAAAQLGRVGEPSPSNWLTGILAKVPTMVLTDSMIRGIEFEAYRAMENDKLRVDASTRIDKPQLPAGVPKFTTGHCTNKMQAGGCPLHNLQCGYPECDKRASTPQLEPVESECETCDGIGWHDELLGGYSFSNPKAPCPDCDGTGQLTINPQPDSAAPGGDVPEFTWSPVSDNFPIRGKIGPYLVADADWGRACITQGRGTDGTFYEQFSSKPIPFVPSRYIRLDSVIAALSAPKQVGVDDWQLVPREPTKAMLDAGVDAAVNKANGNPWCPYAWRAMLAAAPQAAPVPVEGEGLAMSPPDGDSFAGWAAWLRDRIATLLDPYVQRPHAEKLASWLESLEDTPLPSQQAVDWSSALEKATDSIVASRAERPVSVDGDETIDCEIAVAPATIFGVGVKLSTVVSAIRSRKDAEGTFAFTTKVRDRVEHPAVELEEIAATIVRDVCELDPADPEHPDTLKVRVADLHAIVARALIDGAKAEQGAKGEE